MKNELIVEHFMRRGQVALLQPYFPSTYSWATAARYAYPDDVLQKMRETQEQRKLTLMAKELRICKGTLHVPR
jgi:hypothetical protein